MNADTFLPVSRLPSEGENVMLLPGKQPNVDVPGGKGMTQCIAASKLLLSSSSSSTVRFVGQFGNDLAAKMLRDTLEKENNVVIPTICSKHHTDLPSGRGYVFLTSSGSVSAVVSGGSNQGGWKSWGKAETTIKTTTTTTTTATSISQKDIDTLLEGVSVCMLQREIPEHVNLLIATEAKKRYGDDIIILQDIGGEERCIEKEMMTSCDYLIPNESELKRLVKSFVSSSSSNNSNSSSDDKDNIEVGDGGDDDEKLSNERIVELAKTLQQHGARNVLVTRGSLGSSLITEDGEILHQPAFPLEPTQVVDETGAGDCYRAAFAVALLEGHSLRRCLEFATAAGCCSVRTNGAVPSTPSRTEVEELYQKIKTTDSVLNIPRGDGQDKVEEEDKDNDNDNGEDDDSKCNNFHHNSMGKSTLTTKTKTVKTKTTRTTTKTSSTSLRGGGGGGDAGFPFLIGSRLNSMKDRPELWEEGPLKTPRDFVKRQAKINGLTCVDFNYPQHFGKDVWTNNEDAKKALADAGLVAGAVCLRYPSRFARGAMNHPDPALRREAIELTKQAAQVATDLGCDEVVVWSAYDGYDYSFQVNYDDKWDELIEAFRECCDAYPNIKFSLEYKPTDENTRFFTVPSTGAALLLVDSIDRPNMGLTLDVGHMLMSGENPGQSIAMVGRKEKLFGIQLNDGYTRLAAEDGMMFGSIHPAMALEIMYQLRRTKFRGHFYFDTFPQRTDPIKEAEYNIQRVKAFWAAAMALEEEKLRQASDEHDAIQALEIVNDALRSI